MIRNPDNKSRRIKELLWNNNITKVFHNAAFDIGFLKASLGVETNDVACTKTLMKMVYPKTSSGLGSTIEKLFDIEIDKSIDHGGWDKEELDDRQLEYAANDVLYLINIYERLIEEVYFNYFRAIDAIVSKTYLEVEGFTDLFDYKQNDYRQTNRERKWWIDNESLYR